MSIIRPFKALRPQVDIANQLASKPYDVMNRAEAKQMALDNAYNFLHITRAEIDVPNEVDIHSEAVYAKAKENLKAFIDKGYICEDKTPCYYIYTLVMDGRSQTGLVALSSVAEYNNNLVKKHEFTRPEKEKDRIDHMLTIGAQTGNVFLAYNDVNEINVIISNWKNTYKPDYDFIADDGITHTIWAVNNEAVVQEITNLFLQKVPHTYIADGHHRAASAAKVAAQLPSNNHAQYFLTTIFPASELAILDYNRVIKDFNGHTEESLLKGLAKTFTVTKVNAMVKPTKEKQLGMYAFGNWYVLDAKPNTYKTDPVNVLDVSIMQQNILSPLFNIQDQRTDKRIDFVGGIRGIQELVNRVDSGDMVVAFSLYPVSIKQLFDIADMGEVMPPKSTWFEPKLRDGLLTHSFA
jgi:uncharacterized protein (DUF1015 family)